MSFSGSLFAVDDVPGAGLSFEGCSWLFSVGLTVNRMTMNLFSRSNQNGAPCEMAKPVNRIPKSFSTQS